jgi:hypothetical protein
MPPVWPFSWLIMTFLETLKFESIPKMRGETCQYSASENMANINHLGRGYPPGRLQQAAKDCTVER